MVRKSQLVFALICLIILAGCVPSFRKGDDLYRIGNYTEAVAILNKYVAKNPNDAVAHYTLADSLYLKYTNDYESGHANSNDLNLSLVHFSKAVELEPKFSEAYGQRGLVYLVLGDTKRAKADLDNAIKLKPSVDRAYYNRATWFEKQGRYADAIEDYKTYLSLSNNVAWKEKVSKNIQTLQSKQASLKKKKKTKAKKKK